MSASSNGAVEIGVKWLSVYAFSTENWKRSPEEVRFLMGFNRDVIHRRVDELHALGVRVRWAGRRPRLWRSVIKELEVAEEKTQHNTVLNLTMCVNYGGRAEIGDACAGSPVVAAGKLNPTRWTSARSRGTSTSPKCPTSTCSCAVGRAAHVELPALAVAYAEMVFQDTLFPDFDRRHLWDAIEITPRDRRFGGAVDKPDAMTADVKSSRGGGIIRATLDLAREALERYLDVNVDDDGAMTFRHADVPCALQGLGLAEGLTC